MRQDCGMTKPDKGEDLLWYFVSPTVLGPDAVTEVRFRDEAPSSPAHVVARWQLYKAWALGVGDPQLFYRSYPSSIYSPVAG